MSRPKPALAGHSSMSSEASHHPPTSPGYDLALAPTHSRNTSQTHAHRLRPRHTRDTTDRHSRIRSRSSVSEDPELPRPRRPPSPPPDEDNAPPPAEEVTATRLAAHYAVLVWASMLGCLARLGLTALGTYDGAVIYALAWSQGVGSGVMGLSLARKNEIVRIYPPIYTFLTTGVAGSITTFSSWMLAGYMAFSNYDGYDRKGLHDTVDGVAYSLSTFAIAMASLRFGEYLGQAIPLLPSWHPRPVATIREKTASPRSSDGTAGDGSDETAPELERRGPVDEADNDDEQTCAEAERRNPLSGRTPILDLVTVGSAGLAYLLVLILYFFVPHRQSWRHDILFPLLLSPPGAMARFALSRINARPPFVDRFPLGTFLINMIATLLIAGTYAAQRLPSTGSLDDPVRCDALYAIQQGFCGCASTVSTFVVEARAVKGFKWKVLYIGGSLVLGHLFVLAIVGGVGWDTGYSDTCAG